MEPPCPAPPEVAFQALEFVRNAPRPTARLADLLSYCQLCCREVQKDPVSMASLMLSHGALLWLSDAANPDNTALKSRLVAEPIVIRVLEQSLGHPTMVDLRLLALDVAEFLSRCKCGRPPLYRLIPTAARWAVNPAKPARTIGPVLPGLLQPGQSMAQAIQSLSLSVLTSLLDSHGNRDTALREAPTLLRVCQSLVEAGPGSCEASRIHYECAFTVLASFIQHPQHGSALAALLVDHACTLVMRQEGPTTSDGLQPGSSQSVYRALKCLINITSPALGATKATIDKVLAAGVPARLQQLRSHPLLQEEARNVLFNLSASAPESYLDLAQPGGSGAAGSSSGTGNGGGGGAASGNGSGNGSASGNPAADAVARKHLAALDVTSPSFNVEDAVFAISTCQNLLSAAPTTYGKAMVYAGIQQAMLAACDRVVDAPALQEFKGLSENAAAMSGVAENCMRFLTNCILHGVLKIVPPGAQVKEHPLVIEMRRCMIPRLRKYLLHPDKVVRSFAAATCFSLGCLTQDMMSQLGTAGPTSIQTRLLARLMDPERALVLQWPGLNDLAPDAVIDIGLPHARPPHLSGKLPALDWWDELKMCDCCGRHNHFRSELGQEPVKLRRCGGCRERRYCSPECAKKHWKCHKAICRRLQQDPERQQQEQQAQQEQAKQAVAQQQAAAAPQQQGQGQQAQQKETAPDFAAWSVRQLKDFLAARGVDFRRCIEKSQLVDLCQQQQDQQQP